MPVPKKPTKLKILEGNPGKRKLNKKEPQPRETTNHPCPDHLEGLAREKWERLAPICADMRVLTEADLECLEMFCRAYADWRAAIEDIDENGTYKGERLRPPVRAANEAVKVCLNMMRELGLTPAARTRIEVKEEDKSSFGDFVKSRKSS